MSSDIQPPDHISPRGRPENLGEPEMGGTPNATPNAPQDAPAWEKTAALPPGYYPSPDVKLPSDTKPGSRRRPIIVALSLLLALIVATVGLLNVLRPYKAPPPSRSTTCASGTPCQIADEYLAAYSGGDYEAMYKLTSSASQLRFSNPAILQGNFKNAHDYIVNRTAELLNAAHIYSMAVTPGKVSQTGNTTAAVAAEVDMTSSWLGAFTENTSIPLVKEQGLWRVNWSPGLVFPQLDDPIDPHYTRRLRLYGQTATRGAIYDRDGHVLAEDETVYQIGVDPTQLKNEATVLKVLSVSLGMPASQIHSMYQGASGFVVIRTTPPALYQKIQEAINSVVPDGVQVQPATGRVYPYGADLAPATGYVQIVDPKDLDSDSTGYYSKTDFIGRDGVEAWGEQYLRPTKGGKLEVVPVNADGSDGQPVYTIAQRTAMPGDDVHTTISLASQQAAMARLRHFNGKAGGAMAVNPITGEVLVLASWPSCDPNDFSLRFQPNIDACVNNPGDPLLNRAVDGAYPVGSIFKLITLSAALEHGVKPTDVFTCPGTFQVPGEAKPRNDDIASGHGSITAPQAVPPSCDVVFWKIAVMLYQKDPTILPDTARGFGLGSSTGIVGLPAGEESAGQLPDLQSPTDAANLATGQGALQATPAQIAMVGAALGNKGIRMQPRLVSAVTTNGSSAAVKPFPAAQIGTLPLSADNLRIVQVAMMGVTETPEGTAYPDFKNYSIRVAGKTGTAESGNGNPPHSWFTCYAPASSLSGSPVPPQIAVGAVVEYSSFGEVFAVPVAKTIISTYLNATG
ncbi:MAG TPA: penicillin-binding transpeptidase domain-containing protein [Ktedonobacterales bacterium]|nr:penicillin-binding transpeptidase domain-containing protein [Ktedonobacterales bacterium]